MNRAIPHTPASPMKSHKASIFRRILLALTACAGLLAACAPSTGTPSVSLPQPETLAAQAADAAAVEAYRQLQAAIADGLEQALAEANVFQQVSFGDAQRIEAASALFAQSLNNPENPEQRVLDPRAFSVGLTPDGAAYLVLTVDSPWGKANEVAIVDTGKDRGMFVTVPGSGVINGKLVFDQAGVYVAATDELGQVKKVVDATYQWVTPDQAEKLNSAGVWGRVVDAYLAGKISYPKDLSPEQKNEFERALVEAEAKLPVAEQKKLIESRFDRSKSGVYEAVIKADGNLEYFDGSWKTLEAMKNKNGEIIPWGKSYDVVSEEGRKGMLEDLFGGEEAWMAEMEEYVAKDKVTAERLAKEQNYSVDTSKFNQRYIAFYRQPESLKFHTGKIPYYTLDGLTVLKNPLTEQFLVSKITTFFNKRITTHKGPYTTGFSSYDVESRNFFDRYKMFLAVNSEEYLTKFYYNTNHFEERWKQEENLPAFETMWASHLEDFDQILREEPNKIQDRLYQITDLLFPDLEQSE